MCGLKGTSTSLIIIITPDIRKMSTFLQVAAFLRTDRKGKKEISFEKKKKSKN